jgi:hypothetical protein
MVPEASLDFNPFVVFSGFGAACCMGVLEVVMQVIFHSVEPTNIVLRGGDLSNLVHMTPGGPSLTSS